MQYVKLGSSDLLVSECCLGTMTYGNKNTQAEGHAQLDYAIANGINYFDMAEMYAAPPTAETYGTTETIIGNWLAKNKEKRKDMIIMTKMTGRGLKHIRNGERLLAKNVQATLDKSLKRLQTDYVDVYQLHWPNRQNPFFNRHWPDGTDFSRANIQREEAEIHEVLIELDKAIKAGKIRYPGLSNESAYGIELYTRLAKEHNLPMMVSMQNEFSLIHSIDWPFVIESTVHNDIAYLPWSALGGGVLSGKYIGGNAPQGSRWKKQHPRHGNFRDTPNVATATAKYVAIAKKHGIKPVQLAYAWCQQFKWVTATIIGASSVEQLKEDIEAFHITLSEECLAEINAVHRDYPIPF